MEVGIPTDKIETLLLTLRSQSGLHNYPPPSLPALPSLTHSVATLDPSPPDQRCRHCHGRLLRGHHSALCFYCGAVQIREEKVEAFGFRSTIGCRWLLQSLDLDGSEIVETSTDGQPLKRGQSTARDKIPLSDVLNLEISWPAETEIIGSSQLKSETQQSSSVSNLAGVDLDNLFTFAKSLASQLEKEKAVINKQTEHVNFKYFSGQENPSFPPDGEKTVASVSSIVGKNNDDFSGWEADFQFADSGSQPEPSISSNHLVSSTGDPSTHMNFAFGSGETSEDNKPKNMLVPSVSATNEWSQHDLSNSLSVLSSHVIQQTETAREVKDPSDNDDSFDVWNSFTSSSNPMEPTKSSSSASEIKPSSGGDDPSDVWDDFASYSNPQDPPKSFSEVTEIKPSTKDSDPFDVWNNFATTSNPQDPPKSLSVAAEINPSTEEGDSFDAWNSFTSFSNPQDPSKSVSSATEIRGSTEDDTSSDAWNFTSSSDSKDPYKGSTNAINTNLSAEDDDSSDVWDDFTSSSNPKEPPKSSSIATEIKASAEDNVPYDAWKSLTSSSNPNDPLKSSSSATENKQSTEDNDSSDIWNDFASSSIAQDPSNTSLASTGIKATPDDVDSYDIWNDFTSSSNSQVQSHNIFPHTKIKPSTEEDDSSDVWNGFTSSLNAHDPFKSSIATVENKPTTGVVDSSVVWDGFSSSLTTHEPLKSSITPANYKLTTGVDDLSDVWSGFTNSSNAHDPFKSSITNNDNKPITGLDNSSDVWDVFSSSFSAENTSMSSNVNSTAKTATTKGQTLDTMLPSSTNNFEDMDFGSFSPSVVLSGSANDRNGAMAEVSTMKRTAAGEIKAGDTVIASKQDLPKSVVGSDDDMENLMSQMHDLSFMLKTELSVPPTKNVPSSSQNL